MAAILPSLVLFVNTAYWLERLSVVVFLIYILTIGMRAWDYRQALSQT